MYKDLGWLPTSVLKSISPPKIIMEEAIGQPYSGYYTQGSGKLVVVASNTEDSTIAHEYCHYLQYISGREMQGSVWNINNGETYEGSIHRYFTTYPWEYEALLFEYKYARNWLNEWWLRKLIWRN